MSAHLKDFSLTIVFLSWFVVELSSILAHIDTQARFGLFVPLSAHHRKCSTRTYLGAEEQIGPTIIVRTAYYNRVALVTVSYPLDILISNSESIRFYE